MGGIALRGLRVGRVLWMFGMFASGVVAFCVVRALGRSAREQPLMPAALSRGGAKGRDGVLWLCFVRCAARPRRCSRRQDARHARPRTSTHTPAHSPSRPYSRAQFALTPLFLSLSGALLACPSLLLPPAVDPARSISSSAPAARNRRSRRRLPAKPPPSGVVWPLRGTALRKTPLSLSTRCKHVANGGPPGDQPGVTASLARLVPARGGSLAQIII